MCGTPDVRELTRATRQTKVQKGGGVEVNLCEPPSEHCLRRVTYCAGTRCRAALNELRVTPVDLHSDPQGRRSYSHFMRGKTEAQAG